LNASRFSKTFERADRKGYRISFEISCRQLKGCKAARILFAKILQTAEREAVDMDSLEACEYVFKYVLLSDPLYIIAYSPDGATYGPTQSAYRTVS
jgi:hypothetical protein